MLILSIESGSMCKHVIVQVSVRNELTRKLRILLSKISTPCLTFLISTCKNIYDRYEQKLDQKAASSIHNITCQRKSNVLSIILYLKCMVQDIKWKNSMEKKNCKNRELQL